MTRPSPDHLRNLGLRFAQLAIELGAAGKASQALSCNTMSAQLLKEADMLRDADAAELAGMPIKTFHLTIEAEAYAIFTGTVKARTTTEAQARARESWEVIDNIDWEKPAEVDLIDDGEITIRRISEI